jgi:hypothetical protein
MNPLDKKLKDLMGFTFPEEQQIPLAPQSEIPQLEGLLNPQQVQQIEEPVAQVVTPPQQQTPPVEESPVSKYQQILKSISNLKAPSVRPSTDTQPDFRDKLAEELKNARMENKADLDQARNKDAQTELTNQLMKSFSQVGEGLANRAGTTNIKMPAAQFASEQAQAVSSNNKEKLASLMEQYQLMSDKEKAKIDAENRKLQAQDRSFERDYKNKMLQLEMLKLGKDTKEKQSAGQRELDKQVAKEYQDWTSGGQKIAQSEISKLRSVADKLRNKELSTGGLTGLFPDRITSKEVLGARADVESTVMNSLRAILGAQFTENEGKRIIQNTWNEGDSTENNLARLDRLVNDLENKAVDKSQKANYFEQSGGTLAGYKANQAPMEKANKAIKSKEYSPSRNQTRVTYSDGTQEILNGRQ